MLKSMTAYARASKSSKLGCFAVEIQSYNRKFLEVNVILPRELSYLETDIRKWTALKISRGKVTLRITASYDASLPISIEPNLPLVIKLKEAIEKIKKAADLKESVSLEMLVKEPGVLVYQDEAAKELEYQSEIKEVVEEALSDLVEMKIKEGEALKEDFLSRIQNIQKSLEGIKEASGSSVLRYREKLKKKLEEALPGVLENEERILREVCLFAEKVDISEEITRLASHITQFSELLEEKRKEIGKTLEFLLQEMNREANTIGAKSDNIELARLVVDIKTEIEKIREQVQNIE